MEKIYLFVSEIFSIKYRFYKIRNYFLNKSGITIIGNLFVDRFFSVHNPGNIIFGKNVCLGHFNKIWAFNKVIFGDNIQTAIGVTIVSGSHNTSTFEPIIENMSVILEGENWIGANVLILGGVRIGRGTIVGAGSVVVNDLPDYSICVGNPCKPIKKRSPASIVIHPFGPYKPNQHE